MLGAGSYTNLIVYVVQLTITFIVNLCALCQYSDHTGKINFNLYDAYFNYVSSAKWLDESTND